MPPPHQNQKEIEIINSSSFSKFTWPFLGFVLVRPCTEMDRKKLGKEPSLFLSPPLFLSTKLYFSSLSLSLSLSLSVLVCAYLYLFPIWVAVSSSSFFGSHMMKKARRFVMGSSPFSSNLFQVTVRQEASIGFMQIPVAVRGEARARLKQQILLQDYEELLKETEAKKKKLQKTNQKKLQLNAEVKFLRRRYKSFAKNPAGETPYRLKKQSHRMPSPSVQIAQAQISVDQIEFPSKDTKQGVSRTSGLLDLNQISLPTAEEMQEFPMEWEPSKADKSERFLMEGDTVANDFKQSVVRDFGNGSSKVGKRKISWLDQVALRA